MPLAECPSCRVKIRVKDEMLGRTAKCPKCASPFTIEDAPPPRPRILDLPVAPAPTPTPKIEVVLDELEEVPAASISERPQAPPARRSPKVEIVEDEFDAAAPHRGRNYEGDDEAISSRRRRRRDEDEGEGDDDDGFQRERAGKRWNGTRSGLQIVFMSVLVILGFGVLHSILGMFPSSAGMRGGPPGRPMLQAGVGAAQVFQTAIGCVMAVTYLVAFIGMCLCCGAPDETTRTRARVAVGCVAGGVVLAFIVLVVGTIFAAGAVVHQVHDAQFNQPPDVGLLGQLAGAGIVLVLGFIVVAGLGLCAFVFWILFHASIGEKFHDSPLRKHAFIFLGGAFGVQILGILFHAVIDAVVANNIQAAAILNGIIQLACNIAFYGWYASLCRQTIQRLS